MKTTLVCINTAHNHYKVWTGEVLPNGNLRVEWGRIGGKCQSKEHQLHRREAAVQKLRSLISEKQQKGYVQQLEDETVEVLEFEGFRHQDQIIDLLVTVEAQLRRWPAHTAVTFDRATGRLISPLGVVDRARVAEASQLVNHLQVRYGAGDVAAIDAYLRVIRNAF
ncbi:WGR domain-containing protein [filamentous cyanobacterium LEGE 11480]|uniref:WGR domain-containing protein n=1 Tax=Romeriopsis navalis LEGE 11480 TaxID=2777977 RepID=A0A928Z5W6_9CYAN|nr:WGR domain-containing protein [Romeriopsis navalis]MBE9032417.1 WGR domain-containing protein [Romeriopsis navalis LEGE 11480]